MYLLGFSLDNLSLMALTVATGFVVDDAIVVLENITRHLEDGKPRFQAALEGAREVGFTVLSSASRWWPCSPRSCSWAGSSGGCSASSP